MSVIYNYIAVPKSRLNELRGKVEVFDFVHGMAGKEPEATQYPSTDIDRDWEALHNLLTNGGRNGSRTLQHKVVFGGRTLRKGHTSVKIMQATTVATVAKYLKKNSFNDIKEAVDIQRLSKMDIYSHNFTTDDIDLLEDSFLRLYRFYSEAAKVNAGVISYYS